MIKGKLIPAIFVSLALLIALVPLFYGCRAARPQTEKSVALLNLSDLTGPLGGINVPGAMGGDDYIKDVNERGGIEGIKINQIIVDTRYDTARAVSAYKRYRTEPKLLMVLAISTGVAKALAPFIENDKLVAVISAAGEFQAKPGRIFMWSVAYQNVFAAGLDWMVKDWKQKGKPGMPVVGYMSWDSAYGMEFLMGGKEYAAQIGVTLLPPELFPTGAPKHDVYLMRLAQGGANYIWAGGIDPTPSSVIRDAHALGLTKNVQMVSDFYGPHETIGIKLHPEAVEGTIIVSHSYMGDEVKANPRSKLWTKYHGRPVEEMDDSYVAAQCWIIDPFLEAVKRASREVGYEKLDGEAMFKAYKSLTGWTPENPTSPFPCSYSETSRQNYDHIFIYKVVNSKLVRITPEPTKVPDAVSLHKW